MRKQHEANVRTSLIGPAMVCATIANVNRDPKKRTQPFTFHDFLPGFEQQQPSRKKQSASDMLAHIMGVQSQIDAARAEIAAAQKR